MPAFLAWARFTSLLPGRTPNQKAVAALAIGALASGALFACATAPAVDGAVDPGGTGDDDGGGTGHDGSSGSSGGPTGDGSSGGPGPGTDGGASDAGGGKDSAPCVATDAGCATGSPGACGAGAMDCTEAGAPYCRPLAVTQPCYSGPVGTSGQGNCKPGVQTCTGTLGACTGEVDPTPNENCFNTTDDDCDGKLNNGCPDHVTLGAKTPLAAQGGAGGGPAAAMCPPGSFVTHSTMYFDGSTSHAAGIGIFCAAPTLVQGASTYTITLTQLQPAPSVLIGGSNGYSELHEFDCGITGLVAGSYLLGHSDSAVEGLGMQCSNGAVTFAADNTLTFAFTQTGLTNYNTFPGGTFFRNDCAANQVLVGYNLRLGNYMDQIQAVCAPLVTVYK